MRDSQRGRVYHAEDVLRTVMDRSLDNPLFTIEGITLTLPPEGKFSRVEDVQRYVDSVLSLPSVVAEYGKSSVRVRPRKGQRVAHYEPNNKVIAVPNGGTRWALREIVILHELAHHFDRSRPAHGPKFASTLINLLGLVMGPVMGLLARILYAQNEVKVA